MRRMLALAALALCLPTAGQAQPPPAAPTAPGPAQGGAQHLGPARPGPTLPFSPAVRVGQVVYLSGMLGTVPETGKLAEGGVEAETTQALRNIEATLRRLDLGLDAVFKCTVMLADMRDFTAFNGTYVTFFPAERRPARSTFGVSGLALSAKVEIECMAHAPSG